MNFRKPLMLGALAFAGAGLFSSGIFSAEKNEATIKQQQLKQVSQQVEVAKPKQEALTLQQARARGLTTHTFPRQHNALVGEDGIKYLAYDAGKGYQLFILEKNKKIPAKNGTFKIEGGGTVKVKDGWIIWSDSVINSRFPHQGYTSGVIGLG